MTRDQKLDYIIKSFFPKENCGRCEMCDKELDWLDSKCDFRTHTLLDCIEHLKERLDDVGSSVVDVGSDNRRY